MKRAFFHLGCGFAAASLLSSLSSMSIAADVSPWDEDMQSAARLIAAQATNTSEGTVFRAGLEIRLNEGWKTYWRYPGDSGVPPAIDTSKSDNVKTVNVLYPAPSRFPDGAGGNSIGYKGDVILPLRVVPKDKAKPATLRLKLNYAVCEKLCIPAEASLELALTGAASGNERLVGAAEARVPKSVHVGEHSTPGIVAVHREETSGKPKVIVDVAAPSGAPVTLYAEGPTQEWALPLPEAVAGAPAGQQRFAFELDGLPPGAKAVGATLRLTAVSGDQAVEALFRLD